MVMEHGAWDLPSPHVTTITVEAADIDAYDHVNNAVYVTWLDRAAWNHSAALGLPVERCLELDRGMAVRRSIVCYLLPAVLGDTVHVGTWMLTTDTKLRALRRFQLRRASDGAALVRAEIEYVCIELSSGRPTRAPVEFRERYVALADVALAYATLPSL